MSETWKTIRINIEQKDRFELTDNDMQLKEEYLNVMKFLAINLKSSQVIHEIIRDLSGWQNSIINEVAKKERN